jgi:hypothetical protein
VSKEFLINETGEGVAKKFIYASPILICYGRVRELTQAGSNQTLSESNCGNDKVTTKNRPCGSDPRAKENIVRVGTHPFGIGLYLFGYKPEFQAEWGYGRQFGVMADEVETVMPEAISVHANGYRMVDYAMLGVEHSVH